MGVHYSLFLFCNWSQYIAILRSHCVLATGCDTSLYCDRIVCLQLVAIHRYIAIALCACNWSQYIAISRPHCVLATGRNTSLYRDRIVCLQLVAIHRYIAMRFCTALGVHCVQQLDANPAISRGVAVQHCLAI